MIASLGSAVASWFNWRLNASQAWGIQAAWVMTSALQADGKAAAGMVLLPLKKAQSQATVAVPSAVALVR
ncbi:hypothetical protein JCM12296A_22690 [Desulfosarcina cetonica]